MSLPTITIWQPWASLIAEGVKTIETRSWKAPDKLIGQTIGIHAAARHPRRHEPVGDWFPYRAGDAGPYKMEHSQSGTGMEGAPEDVRLPLGAIVATARLTACLPMGRIEWCDEPSYDCDVEWLLVNAPGISASVAERQRPYGDFAPGRWAWMLDDIKPTTERCPWCLGEGGDPDDAGWQYYGITEPGSRGPCPVCRPDVVHDRPLGTCAPVPAKGRQKVWNWTP